ncbi:MAG: single-stranded DNA-binding protein [Planctomycetota bacterium]
MTGFNKVILMGNCTREPELRYTPSGAAVTDFRLAVNRVFGAGESRKQETLFIDIQAWGKSAETLNRFVKKGDPLLVEGRLVLDQWEANGERRSKIKVVAESFQFISRTGPGTTPSGRNTGVNLEDQVDSPPDDDEVPF